VTNVVMAGDGNEGFVELARRNGVTPKGRLFRKQILHFGDFEHPKLPGKKITVDEDFAEKLVTNFSNGMCDIVQAPIVDGENKHTEDPLRNTGQVIDLDYEAGKGVYAYLDARNAEHAEQLGKTLIGASAMLNLDYTDTKTGAKVGPTLLHMAVTNRPYITNLDGYEEVIAASADTPGETVLLGAVTENPLEDEMPKTKEELIAALKDEHGIDVEALQAKKDEPADLTALSNALGADGQEMTLQDVADAVVELSSKLSTSEETVVELTRKNAEKEIDDLVHAGRILPKQRDTMLELSLSNRDQFEALLPEEPIVSLSEDGVTTHTSSQSEAQQAEIDRLADIANGNKK